MKGDLKSEGEFSYLERGEGPILLILHGLFGALSNFKEVFEDFCNIGIFSSINLDQTIGDFRRLEEASLNYMGGGNQETKVGLLDTVISREDL